MFINEDFFDDINTEQISSTDGVEDISSPSVDLSSYETFLSFEIIKPKNVNPNLEELKKYLKRLTYILSASSMIRQISEPGIKEKNSLSRDPFLSPEEAYELDDYYIGFGVRLLVNSLTKFYNLLNFIFNKLNPNPQAVRIFQIEIIDKRSSVPHIYFTRYDFTTNRREKDFIRRMTTFCNHFLRTKFDYNELKSCMGLDTIKQLTHLSLTEYENWSVNEIKLSYEWYPTKNLPREFFFKCSCPKFYSEPDLTESVMFGNDSSKTEDIVKFCHSRDDVRVYPKLYIAKRGKGVKILFRMLFDKVCGNDPSYYKSFGFMWEHQFSTKDNQMLVPMWIGTSLSPYVYLGEDIDYLIEELKPVIAKFATTDDIYTNIKKYATWNHKK